MNDEIPTDKTGLMGEYLVKLRLNEYGVNTGSVDKDTGTDTVMFLNKKILTAQVKSGRDDWNKNAVHGVHVHFRVKLNFVDGLLQLDTSEIVWKWFDIPDSEFKSFRRESIAELFQ